MPEKKVKLRVGDRIKSLSISQASRMLQIQKTYRDGGRFDKWQLDEKDYFFDGENIVKIVKPPKNNRGADRSSEEDKPAV